MAGSQDSGGPTATVTGIHLHPVKSCRRVEVERATIGARGLVGDREWQVVTPDGTMITQRQQPALARVRPVPIEGGLRLQCDDLPDVEVARPVAAERASAVFFGRVRVGDAGDEAAAWFERLLGVECRLAAIAPGYTRRVHVDGADMFGQEVALADAAPVLLANAASHRDLLARAREPFGIERFRPNLVVDGAEPWEEDTWRTATLGEARLRMVLPWPRCSIPQVDQDTGERRREPAVVLRRHRWCTEAPGFSETVTGLLIGNGLFGVGCAAGPEGAEIAVGQDLVVGERSEALLTPPASRDDGPSQREEVET